MKVTTGWHVVEMLEKQDGHVIVRKRGKPQTPVLYSQASAQQMLGLLRRQFPDRIFEIESVQKVERV